MASSPRPGRSVPLGFDALEDRDTPATGPGFLDSTFAINGLAQVPFFRPTTVPATTTAATSNAVAVQADGKIVLAGSSPSMNAAGGLDFAVARLNANGTLDTTFGTGGE